MDYYSGIHFEAYSATTMTDSVTILKLTGALCLRMTVHSYKDTERWTSINSEGVKFYLETVMS